MNHNEEIFEKENVPMGPLFMVLGVTVFFTAAIVLALTGLYQAELNYRIDKWGAEPNAETVAHDAEQNERLTTYAKLENDLVQIPIERAMELVLAEGK